MNECDGMCRYPQGDDATTCFSSPLRCYWTMPDRTKYNRRLDDSTCDLGPTSISNSTLDSFAQEGASIIMLMGGQVCKRVMVVDGRATAELQRTFSTKPFSFGSLADRPPMGNPMSIVPVEQVALISSPWRDRCSLSAPPPWPCPLSFLHAYVDSTLSCT